RRYIFHEVRGNLSRGLSFQRRTFFRGEGGKQDFGIEFLQHVGQRCQRLSRISRRIREGANQRFLGYIKNLVGIAGNGGRSYAGETQSGRCASGAGSPSRARIAVFAAGSRVFSIPCSRSRKATPTFSGKIIGIGANSPNSRKGFRLRCSSAVGPRDFTTRSCFGS